MADTGGSTNITIQAQDSVFTREGQSTQTKGYFLPGNLLAAIVGSYVNAQAWEALTTPEVSFLNYVLTQDPQCLPGGLTLFNLQSLDWEAFSGAAELAQIWQKNPFSTAYETSTADLYNRSYAIARSTAQSGPQNVRGGTARMGFELAELDTQQSINRFREVWQNQIEVAKLVLSGVQIHNAVVSERRQISLGAQQAQANSENARVAQGLQASQNVSQMRADCVRANAAGGEFLGAGRMVQEEAIFGQGYQQGTTTSYGASYFR